MPGQGTSDTLATANGKPGAVVDDAARAAQQQDHQAEVEEEAGRMVGEDPVVDAEVEREPGEVADDLDMLVDEVRVLTVAEPTDAKLLLEALEALQEANPKVLADKRAARIVADLVALAESLSRSRQPESVYRQARVAVRAVAAGNLDLAEAIVAALKRQVSADAPAYLVLKGAVAPFLIVVALGAIAFALQFWVLKSTSATPLSLEASAAVVWNALSSNIIVVSATFGLLGSLVSVLLRLSDFDGSRRSRQFLLFAGGVLPVVGAIFATVVCAIFASGIVGTNLVAEPLGSAPATIFFYVVAGFVAGFSERFARGLVGVFESQATPSDVEAEQPDRQPG